MALNKENATALFQQNMVGGKLVLPHDIRTGIMAEITEKMLLREMSKAQQPFGESAGGYDFYKVAKSELTEKTSPGQSFDGVVKADIISVRWNKPKHGGRKYLKADLKMGVPELSAFHLMKYADDFKKATEQEGFSLIETTITQNVETISGFKDLEPKEMIKKIVKVATQLTQYVDVNDNINYIDREKIVIFVKPEIKDTLSLAGLIGNSTRETLLEGQYSFNTLMGYKIFDCPYLKTWDVMVATDFSIVSAFRFINASAGTIGNTQDLEVLFEAQSLMGILYPKTIRGIKDLATRNVSSSAVSGG